MPLSLLDHNLICGNSLVGIGTVSEIEQKAQDDDLPLFAIDVQRLVGEALEPLRRLARITDATAAELTRARKAMAEALRNALVTGSYPGMGTGDPDLYKAFCWRFWNLITSEGGWLGVVLPRSAWNAKGSTLFRVEVFKQADPANITMLVNNRQWVFPEVYPQYSIALVGLRRAAVSGNNLKLRGPFRSLERFHRDIHQPPAEFTGEEVMGWTDTASLPLLPTEESLEIFAQLRKAPRLDVNEGRSWRARPHTELHARNDKRLMDLQSRDCPRGFWPVFKGESFDIWDPDTGRYYAWADPNAMIPHLHKKSLRGTKLKKSAFSEFEPRTFANSTRWSPTSTP